MWGTDTKGCLQKPLDRQDEKKIEVPLALPTESLFDQQTVRSVVCGATDTAWITADGSCYVAGENKSGQLGLGHKDPVLQPTRLELPSSIQHVALGPSVGAFVDAIGDLYTCGFGGSTLSGFGALAHGDLESYTTPQRVESLVEDGCAVQQVQVGESHITVLTTEGEVLTAGAGSYGRLGNYETADQLYLEPLELLADGVTQISGGKSFTLALKDDGIVYGWGRNHKGQLGTGLGLAVDMYAMQALPEPIETDELVGRKVIKIEAGHSHAACITEGGELFYWGMSLHLEPVRVDELLHTEVVDVFCGEDYTLALDKDGQLYSIGKGKTGVLGQGSIKQLNQATRMEALDGYTVQHVSAGWKHAACLAVAKA